MIVIYTNGAPVRTYVGTTLVPRDADGGLDPVKLACAQLREDCKADRAKLMRDFRVWVWRGLGKW